MSSRTKALIAIVFASLLWSTAGVAKIVVHTFDPYTAAFLRFFVASLIMLPLFLREKKQLKHLVQDLVPLAILSSANIGFYYVGLATSTASAAALIYAGVPILTAIGAHYIISERLSIQKLTGIIIGLAGVLLIALLPVLEKHGTVTGAFPGNLFFLAAVVVWSLYAIASRHAITKQGYSPIAITSVSIFTTCAVFFILATFRFRLAYIPSLIHPPILLLILYLGLLVTVGTYLLFQWGVQHSSATTASLNNYLQPVFAIFFNVLFLGEKISLPFFVGTLLVFTGVLITSGSSAIREVRSWFLR